ncbi:hypothetical protein GBF38_001902, partial [Nibea albiflora]
NYTKDNKTQGIMEKSQWDLKRIRFQHKRLTRFDDFVHTYKRMHQALLREHKDSLKIKKKLDTEPTINTLLEEAGQPPSTKMQEDEQLVMEGLFHLYAKQLNLGRAIFLLDHYTAGVILFGTADRVRQHSLRRLLAEGILGLPALAESPVRTGGAVAAASTGDGQYDPPVVKAERTAEPQLAGVTPDVRVVEWKSNR